MFEINLQLFAEEKEDINIDEVNIEEDTDLEVDTDEEDAGEETHEEGETQEEANEEGKQEEKMVPLRALEAERKKWKERLNDPELKKKIQIAERIAQASGKKLEDLEKELDALTAETYIKQGLSPEMAQAFIQTQRQMLEIQNAMRKQERDREFAELKNNPFYSDAEEYREELENYANSKNLTIKEAYNALFADKKLTNLEREIEQRILNNLAKKQKIKIDTSPSGENKPKAKVKLTPEEEAIAKMAGMTPQEYLAMKKAETIEHYRKLKNKE